MLGKNVDYEKIHLAFGLTLEQWDQKVQEAIKFFKSSENGGITDLERLTPQTVGKVILYLCDCTKNSEDEVMAIK